LCWLSGHYRWQASSHRVLRWAVGGGWRYRQPSCAEEKSCGLLQRFYDANVDGKAIRTGQFLPSYVLKSPVLIDVVASLHGFTAQHGDVFVDAAARKQKKGDRFISQEKIKLLPFSGPLLALVSSTFLASKDNKHAFHYMLKSNDQKPKNKRKKKQHSSGNPECQQLSL
jgi:hypothetical protein